MNSILIVPAFIIMSGIAIIFATSLKLKMNEGMMLSAAFITLVMWIFGLFSAFDAGVIILCILGVVGCFLLIILICSKRATDMLNPAYFALLVIFISSIILYYGDFIQHIDELHQWALAVKHMLNSGNLPKGPDYLGDSHQLIGTSLFILFFQKITGYNESYMYVSAAFLSFLGFLLPFSNVQKKEWYKIVVYVLLLYVMIYPLYRYGFKNLYVDMPVISWTSGTALYFIMRDKKKKLSNTVLMISSITMIFFFKLYVGLLLDLFLLMLIVCGFIEDRYEKASDIKKKDFVIKWTLAAITLCIATILGVFLLIVYFTKNGVIDSSYIATVTKAYFKSFFTETINQRSSYHVRPVMILLAIGLVIAFRFRINKGKNSAGDKLVIASAGLFGTGYIVALWLAYLLIFNSAESAQAFGAPRYFSTMLTMLITFFIAEFMLNTRSVIINNKHVPGMTVQMVFATVLLLFFMLGVNKKFIADSTAYCDSSLSSYEVMMKAHKHIAKIENILTENDRVYMLHQGADLTTLNNKSQFPQNMALYYLGNQVNNCLYQPWKLFEGGSYVAITKTDLFTIDNLPGYLAEGGYTYLWIFRSDDYIKEKLPTVIKVDGGVKNASLYRIIYENGNVSELEYVCKLN